MSSDLTSPLSEDLASRFSSQRFGSAHYESVDDVEPAKDEGVESVDDVEPTKDEGVALIEWRRQNAIRLEEKEKKEKEMVKNIIAEADRYKEDYYGKWIVKLETSKSVNREKEKLFLESGEKFHTEADKSYWKAVAELIPKEVPTIEKKGKKEKNASIVVIQGPKPGKPTDLSRMRQVLVKLKHKPSPHIMSLNAHTATVPE